MKKEKIKQVAKLARCRLFAMRLRRVLDEFLSGSGDVTVTENDSGISYVVSGYEVPYHIITWPSVNSSDIGPGNSLLQAGDVEAVPGESVAASGPLSGGRFSRFCDRVRNYLCSAGDWFGKNEVPVTDFSDDDEDFDYDDDEMRVNVSHKDPLVPDIDKFYHSQALLSDEFIKQMGVADPLLAYPVIRNQFIEAYLAEKRSELGDFVELDEQIQGRMERAGQSPAIITNMANMAMDPAAVIRREREQKEHQALLSELSEHLGYDIFDRVPASAARVIPDNSDKVYLKNLREKAAWLKSQDPESLLNEIRGREPAGVGIDQQREEEEILIHLGARETDEAFFSMG
jgi:hypothetical protein